MTTAVPVDNPEPEANKLLDTLARLEEKVAILERGDDGSVVRAQGAAAGMLDKIMLDCDNSYKQRNNRGELIKPVKQGSCSDVDKKGSSKTLARRQMVTNYYYLRKAAKAFVEETETYKAKKTDKDKHVEFQTQVDRFLGDDDGLILPGHKFQSIGLSVFKVYKAFAKTGIKEDVYHNPHNVYFMHEEMCKYHHCLVG
jgi:hypothetical protein